MPNTITTSTIQIFDSRNTGSDPNQIRYKDISNQNSIDVQAALTKCLSLEWSQAKVSHVPTNLCVDGHASQAATLEVQFQLDGAVVFRSVKQTMVPGDWHINADFLIQAVKSGSHTLDVMISASSGDFTIAAGSANLYIQLTGLIGALTESVPKINITQAFLPVSINFNPTINVPLSDAVLVTIQTPIPITLSEPYAVQSVSFSVPQIGMASINEAVTITFG